VGHASFIKTSERESIKCDLAGQVLRAGGKLRLRALGLSMLPTLWPGDILIINSKTYEQVSRGDIVLYAREREFFVHRIICKSSDSQYLITQGDGLSKPDPPVSRQDLLGRVSAIERCGLLREPNRANPIFHRILAHTFWPWNLVLRIVLGVYVRRNFLRLARQTGWRAGRESRSISAMCPTSQR
jgi:signal peptidase I